MDIFKHMRSVTATAVFGAHCPSQSGLIHKHIVTHIVQYWYHKHIVKLMTYKVPVRGAQGNSGSGRRQTREQDDWSRYEVRKATAARPQTECDKCGSRGDIKL